MEHGKHVLAVSQFFDRSLLNDLFNRASMLAELDKQSNLQPTLRSKILATIFYEPSTRTRFSFESAMQKLGGNVITTESAGLFSSAIKGESLEDSIRVCAGYADAIVLRHPELGAAARAASVSSVPIINAGDGPGEHPTQALLDVYTIQKELGKLDNLNNLNVVFAGDLLYGRTVHSLLQLLLVFPNISLQFVSPQQLALPQKYRDLLTERKARFTETNNLDEVLPSADVLYVTRVQKERFASQEDYEKVKSAFVITRATLDKMKQKSIVMHPLPRVTEISPDIDSDPRAAYFRQAANGLYVRMALLEKVLAP